MLLRQVKGRNERASVQNGPYPRLPRVHGLYWWRLVCSTFTAISEKGKILAKLEEVAAELEEDMERTGWTGKTVTLKYKLNTYQGLHPVIILGYTSDSVP